MGYHPQPYSNPLWQQATWFIDPVGGNDDSDGLTAGTAVKSYNGGVAARWGTTSPYLAQDTTITWLSSQPAGGDDPVVLKPIMCKGAILTVKGTPSLVRSGALGAVTPRSRAAGAGVPLSADLGVATAQALLIENTTAGKSSWAWVYNLTVGTTYELSQPIVPAPVPLTALDFDLGPVDLVDTWANGDTYDIYDLTSIDLVQVSCTVAEFSTARSWPPAVQLTALSVDPSDGIAIDAGLFVGTAVSLERVRVNKALMGAGEFPNYDGVTDTPYWNIDLENGASSMDTSVGLVAGVVRCGPTNSQLAWNIDYDSILDAGASTIEVGAPYTGQSGPSMGTAYINGIFTFMSAAAISMLESQSSVGGIGILYGPGSLQIMASTRIIYKTANAAVSFAFNGTFKMNGSANGVPFDPATATFQGAIPLSGANLDAAFGPAGFGGTALSESLQACVTNVLGA